MGGDRGFSSRGGLGGLALRNPRSRRPLLPLSPQLRRGPAPRPGGEATGPADDLPPRSLETTLRSLQLPSPLRVAPGALGMGLRTRILVRAGHLSCVHRGRCRADSADGSRSHPGQDGLSGRRPHLPGRTLRLALVLAGSRGHVGARPLLGWALRRYQSSRAPRRDPRRTSLHGGDLHAPDLRPDRPARGLRLAPGWRTEAQSTRRLP